MSYRILIGDVLDRLRELPDESVHCVVTSPPYYGLRDYGVVGQIGLEASPAEFIGKLTEVFREVRRVLRSNGTAWVNMGDSYANDGKWGGSTGGKHVSGLHGDSGVGRGRKFTGLKPKDLMGMPWRLAFALQEDGWWLRQDIIWAKPNPMPESIQDRCTKAHEYLFLLSKSERYHYDSKAIREECLRGDAGSSYTTGKTAGHQEGRAGSANRRTCFANSTGVGFGHGYDATPKPRVKTKVPGGWDTGAGGHGTIHRDGRTEAEYVETPAYDTRNKRSVWSIATEPYAEAHFATFPTKLVEPCILAGCPVGGTVLDPFSGSGTTGVVALRHGREYIGIELNPEYAEMSRRRLDRYWDTPVPVQEEGYGPLFEELA